MIAMPNPHGIASLYGLSGWQIIESLHCTKDAERTVDRSWSERLFSWPWRPRMATKVMTVQVPDEKVYVVDGKMLVCHPMVAVELRARLFGEEL